MGTCAFSQTSTYNTISSRTSPVASGEIEWHSVMLNDKSKFRFHVSDGRFCVRPGEGHLLGMPKNISIRTLSQMKKVKY